MHRIFETPEPSVALVIGTFAAVPYVHLALESRRRYFPSVPLLVSDDCSPAASELEALCRQYDAEFRRSSRRSGHRIGDVSSYVYGLEWATSLGVELLVKMSRRFIPLHNWVPDLRALAWETQYATYSQRCLHFNYGFRTECIGLHVAGWRSPAIQRDLREPLGRDQEVFVEGFIHRLARRIQGSACDLNRRHVALYPRHGDSDAYGIWPIMPDRRTTKKPDILWHDCDSPADYCRVSQLFGLNYSLEDFADPDMIDRLPNRKPRRNAASVPLLQP
jgi:hypothetical protein